MLNKYYHRFRHQLPLVILTTLITLSFLAEKTGILHVEAIDRAENLLYDLRVRMTMPNDMDKRIVIVDIDEKSLQEIGRWPWSRNHVARLVDQLFDHYGIQILGFDIVFPEPDDSSGLNILMSLGRNELAGDQTYQQVVTGLEDELNYDQLLAESIRDRPVIMGYYFKYGSSEDYSSNNGLLPEPGLDSDMFAGKAVVARNARGYSANLPVIQEAALDAGHFSPWLDEDGVVRRVPMLYAYEGDYYEALSLAVVRNLFQVEQTIPVFESSASSTYPGLENLSLEFIDIPVDENIQALVPYRGYQESYRYVSAADVINRRVDKEVLEDAIVLVGTTVPGLFDLRTTPVNKQFPGVEIHANLISGIIDENIKLSPAYLKGAEILQILVIGVLMTMLLPLLSPVWASISTLTITIIVISINLMLWQYSNLVMPIASSLLLIGIIFVANMSYGFFIERRGKQQLATIFGTYIPPELIDEMNNNPGSYTLEPENREMTVLFSDVRGFTTISEGLTPAELSSLMNAYLTEMTRIIHDKRGTIDKYIGDAVMAFWGAPLENPDHASAALDTALAMLHRLKEIRKDFIERGWPELNIGVGINSGVMSVGNMGSEFRLSYTVMGDAVNLGSRLEGLTKSYGVELIVSETTRAAAPDYVYRELDYVRVKGKDKPIAIYEPVALQTAVSAEELEEIELMDAALKAYRKQEWYEAEILFTRLKSRAPGRKIYAIYLERIARFIEKSPGLEWDGVFTFTTK